jgi:hypothetical protein
MMEGQDRLAWAAGVVAMTMLAGVAMAQQPAGRAEVRPRDQPAEVRTQVEVRTTEQAEVRTQDEVRQPGEPAIVTHEPVPPEGTAEPAVPHPLPMEKFTAGYQDGRFVLQSEDDRFVLRPGVQFQMRHVFNYRDDGGGDTESGFEFPRLRVALDGNAFGPDLKYLVIFTNNRVGGINLLDAFVTYHLGDGLHLRAGQFKDPVSHEFRLSTQRLWAAEPSLQNSLIAGGQSGYVQGVSLIYDPQTRWRAEVAVHDGYGSINTGWEAGGGNAFVGVAPTDFGFSGRGEYMVFGESWRQYSDLTAMGTREDMLVIGAGADWSQAGSENAFFHTIDASYKTERGLAVFGALNGLYADRDDVNLYDWGVLGQVGQMLNPRWEAFGRLGYTRLDGDRNLAERTVPELTIGANYYIRGHQAKLTLDGTWLPNGSPLPVPGVGARAGTDDQFIIRSQLQLLF